MVARGVVERFFAPLKGGFRRRAVRYERLLPPSPSWSTAPSKRRVIVWKRSRSKILEGKPQLNWEYDEEADVLYISVGEPRPAVGVDIGEGVIVRWDEEKKEIVGLTIIGLRARLAEGITPQQ